MHQIKINDKEYTVKGSVKYNLAVGVENMDNEGKRNGEETARAIAAIFENYGLMARQVRTQFKSLSSIYSLKILLMIQAIHAIDGLKQVM